MLLIGMGVFVVALVSYTVYAAYAHGVSAGASAADLSCERRVGKIVQQHTQEVQDMQKAYTESLERVVRRMQALQRSIQELNAYYEARIKELKNEASDAMVMAEQNSTDEFDSCVIPPDLLRGLNDYASASSKAVDADTTDTTTTATPAGAVPAPATH